MSIELLFNTDQQQIYYAYYPIFDCSTSSLLATMHLDISIYESNWSHKLPNLCI